MYDHSPLRRASFDLCERLATRTAALIAIQEVPAAWARYLKTRLAPDDVDRRPRAAAPPSGDDGGALARELADRVCELQQYRDALGDHCADTGKAAAWLQDLLDTPAFESASGSAIDPPAIANNILRIRGELAAAWAEAIVDDVKGEHAVLRREILERSLVAE